MNYLKLLIFIIICTVTFAKAANGNCDIANLPNAFHPLKIVVPKNNVAITGNVPMN